jgi:hypothetical protein
MAEPGRIIVIAEPSHGLDEVLPLSVAFASLLLLHRRAVEECPILTQDAAFIDRRAQVRTLP